MPFVVNKQNYAFVKRNFTITLLMKKKKEKKSIWSWKTSAHSHFIFSLGTLLFIFILQEILNIRANLH